MSIAKKTTDLPALPKELEGLAFLASNLYYTWARDVREIFQFVDRGAWEHSGHNPIFVLKKLSLDRIETLRQDGDFLSKLEHSVRLQRKYLADYRESWFARTYGDQAADNSLVAYFSMEFGAASCLKVYSGGLGVLSGDHLKSSSDLGIPLVGIGLFYTTGYFSQGLNADGWQVEHYPINKPEDLPIEPLMERHSEEPLVFPVSLADREVKVKVWKASIGRISLYLLDTNIPAENSVEDCTITRELYGGDSDNRIKQEIVLGLGGAKLVRLLGLNPSVFHMNEGHSSFVSLERISQSVQENDGGKSFSEALRTVKSSTIFTTHTPVPAGIDIFTRGQIEHYLSQYPARLGICIDEVFSLGQESQESAGFNMAVFAIRTSSMVNGVSNLHGQVARKLWERVLQEEDELDYERTGPEKRYSRKMQSVTNGVHIASWISDSMAGLLDEYLGRGWELNSWKPETWRPISKIPPDRLWQVREKSRADLLQYVHRRLGRHSRSLDNNALTIGFARRFATYKRATLLFSDHSRLERILHDAEKPIQFIFAGKAHPRDYEGKKLIQEIVTFLKRELAGGKIVFIRDYDIEVARKMVQGVDVWLNNPRRPFEASGTSGMKILCNGGLNMSVLDGWWDEAYTPSNGWAIGTGGAGSNYTLQDRQDAESLYDLLQNHVIPEFYERTNGLPLKWVDRMRRSMSTLTPRFSSSRMVVEYAEDFYFKNLGKANTSEENSEAPNHLYQKDLAPS